MTVECLQKEHEKRFGPDIDPNSRSNSKQSMTRRKTISPAEGKNRTAINSRESRDDSPNMLNINVAADMGTMR